MASLNLLREKIRCRNHEAISRLKRLIQNSEKKPPNVNRVGDFGTLIRQGLILGLILRRRRRRWLSER